MVYGAPSVTMDGDLLMLVLCAGNLDMHMRVLDQGYNNKITTSCNSNKRQSDLGEV